MSIRPRPSVVVFAKSVTTLAAFYKAVADMEELEVEEGHVVLEVESFQLVVHGIPKAIAASIHITAPPEIREDTPIKLCLPVDSIAVARERALGLGGRVGPKAKEWEARGFRACDGYDPEGNVFQVRENASQ